MPTNGTDFDFLKYLKDKLPPEEFDAMMKEAASQQQEENGQNGQQQAQEPEEDDSFITKAWETVSDTLSNAIEGSPLARNVIVQILGGMMDDAKAVKDFSPFLKNIGVSIIQGTLKTVKESGKVTEDENVVDAEYTVNEDEGEIHIG